MQQLKRLPDLSNVGALVRLAITATHVLMGLSIIDDDHSQK